MDFNQNGRVATLHNFGTFPLEEMERELVAFSQSRKISLILPSLYSELEGQALALILDELQKVEFVSNVIIGLDRADEHQYRHAKQYFSRLPQEHVVLWNDGPRLRQIDETLASEGLSPAEPGKGRNVWFCIGYALAAQTGDVLAIHDCDIVTYSKEMLARLVYPVANPSMPYQFCKGYYPRIADGKLNGRVTRLLVTPLLLALKKVFGENEYLDYLKGFRYPLAGEMAMRTAIMPEIRIPSDWGLEIGMLSEVYRNLNSKSVCQVDIADTYDHKHQPLSEDDSTAGLSRMSSDITRAVFGKMAIDGVVFTEESFRTIKATYLRIALDMVDTYYNDALMNGMQTDRHEEERAVELFAANVSAAGKAFLNSANETPFIPAWSRVQAADRDLLPRMVEAVRLDNEEYC